MTCKFIIEHGITAIDRGLGRTTICSLTYIKSTNHISHAWPLHYSARLTSWREYREDSDQIILRDAVLQLVLIASWIRALRSSSFSCKRCGLISGGKCILYICVKGITCSNYSCVATKYSWRIYTVASFTQNQ